MASQQFIPCTDGGGAQGEVKYAAFSSGGGTPKLDYSLASNSMYLIILEV